MFNRFWRADPSRQRQTGGTGLGLAISLEDARLHGGWLQAFGRPGEGARFRLTLPRRQGTLLLGSPLPLDPDEAAGPAGPASVSQFTHSVPEEMQLPVSAVPVAMSGDGFFSASALSALSSGFSSGAAADPDEHRPESG